jgi:hypothetical protein
MSQLKVDTITDEAGTGSPSLPNGLTVGGVNYPSTGPLSNRNKIINGAMVIDQRNAGAAVTITGTDVAQYVLDRWYLRAVSATGSKVSVQRSSVAPAGFLNSQLITSLSAYSIGASEHFGTIQFIEGFNAADLGWGTSAAQTVTLSFKVRSSVTGTFGGFLTNSAGDRVYVFSYTINAADTYEDKTIVVAGDTTGTWLKDNGAGIGVSFSVAAGASTTGAAGSWGSTLFRSVTGQTSLVGTSGATWQITGVQLEAGTVATPFEHRSFGQELALCQRYYYRVQEATFSRLGIVAGTTSREAPIFFPVTMRAAPSVTLSGGGIFRFATATAEGGGTPTAIHITVQGCLQVSTGLSAGTSGQTCAFDNWLIQASAEL